MKTREILAEIVKLADVQSIYTQISGTDANEAAESALGVNDYPGPFDSEMATCQGWLLIAAVNSN